MTSKTFKCVEHEEEVLEVYPFTGDEAGRKFSLLMPHVSSNAGIAFDSTTAPALALAILEAAYGSNQPAASKIGEAWAALYTHIADEERATAEAEAQAKLEAEALRLANEFYGADWDFFPCSRTVEMQQWLAVARRARELNKENQ